MQKMDLSHWHRGPKFTYYRMSFPGSYGMMKATCEYGSQDDWLLWEDGQTNQTSLADNRDAYALVEVAQLFPLDWTRWWPYVNKAAMMTCQRLQQNQTYWPPLVWGSSQNTQDWGSQGSEDPPKPTPQQDDIRSSPLTRVWVVVV